MSQEDRDKNLQALLYAAKTEGFTFNENKSIYSVRQLGLLGYRVSHGQIKPDPACLQLLMNYSVPKSQKELKKCLGMFAYYACWIAKFSEKIIPLTRLTNFPMEAKKVQAFESLRHCLLAACCSVSTKMNLSRWNVMPLSTQSVPCKIRVVVQLLLCLERYHQVNVATLPSKRRPRRS